jgi:hypothetical protein
VQVVFNSVLGEDLLFRGLLLPRMRGVFGRGDFVANGVLFAVYHLHQPWAIPAALGDIVFTASSTIVRGLRRADPLLLPGNAGACTGDGGRRGGKLSEREV